MHLCCLAALVALFLALPAHSTNVSNFMKELQAIVDQRAVSYNCSVSAAVHFANGSTITIASGTVDANPASSSVVPDDLFVWGSVTKVWTGAAVMRLSDQGVLSLDDPASPLVDPMLKKTTGSSMSDLFGTEANSVTIRQLLAMQSGIPDFDTAKPYPRPPTDEFRASVYVSPSHDFTPAELLGESWVKTGKLLFPPGSKTSYSSSNFILLGMLLAGLEDAESWDSFDQFKFLPEALASQYKHVEFIRHGSPSSVSRVHGLDRTDYNNRTTQMDVFDVHGVFSGWTASDFVASASDTARFFFDVYGPTNQLLTKAAVAQMIPTSPFYGLATFNLSYVTGHEGLYGSAYGHLGATYGYDSIGAYFPDLQLAIAVGTNIETDQQAQPADTLCGVYNRVKNELLGEPVQTCAFVSKSYYGASCNCTAPAIPTRPPHPHSLQPLL